MPRPSIRLALAASVAIAFAFGPASPCHAQGRGRGQVDMLHFGNAGVKDTARLKRVAVKVEAADGSKVAGELSLGSVAVKASVGVYEIDPAKVRAIRFDVAKPTPVRTVMASNEMIFDDFALAGTVETTDGQTIKGAVLIPHWWRVVTDIGPLAADPEQLRSMTFGEPAKPAEPPMPAEPAR